MGDRYVGSQSTQQTVDECGMRHSMYLQQVEILCHPWQKIQIKCREVKQIGTVHGLFPCLYFLSIFKIRKYFVSFCSNVGLQISFVSGDDEWLTDCHSLFLDKKTWDNFVLTLTESSCNLLQKLPFFSFKGNFCVS